MIAFTPFNSEQIIIGGQTGFGAFPKYSIQKDVASITSDGGILNSKYSITISGKFVVDSSIDIMDTGARQSKYNAMLAERVNYLKNSKGSIGKLEISPYGGKPGKIIYNDARLININIPESSDESSSILYSDYSLTFEAYIDASIGDGNTVPAFDYQGYLLSSVEESWSIEKEDTYSYELNNPSSDPVHNYVITHTLSATGLRKANSGGTGFQTAAWKEAERWVTSRLRSAPLSSITTELMGIANVENPFNPMYFSDTASGNIPSLAGFSSYNHVRTPSVNFVEGSYSITETWSMSKTKAAIDIEASIDIDQNDVVSISVSGTVTGFSELSPDRTNVKKIENAETVFNTLKSNLFTFANLEYAKLGVVGTLQNIVRSSSIGKNKTTGTLTFNYSYNDTPVLINGAKNSNISINYDNDGYQTEVIAIIPVIARSQGPVIQKMKTSKERRRSAQLDIVMAKANRTAKPEGYAAISSYAPQGASVTIQNFVENWEPLSGNYSLNVEWVY